MSKENEELDFDITNIEDPIEVGNDLESQPTNEKETQEEEPKPEPKKRGPKPKNGESKGTETESKSKETPGRSSKDEISDEEEPESEPEEETKEEEESEENNNFILELANKMGVELPEGIDFEDSEDGLMQFSDYVADVKADEKLNGWLSALPPVATDFFDYLQMLGDSADEDKIKEFFTTVKPEIDYKSVDLTDVNAQKAVMRTLYKSLDYSDDEIKDAIEDLEIANTLEKQAKLAAGKLAVRQEKERENMLHKERAEAQMRKEAVQQFFGNVKGVIESGKVNNFTIPVQERRAIFEYDAKGQFMEDLNAVLKDPAKRVELAIALKNKFNLDKYVKTAAATQRATSLKDKVKSSKMKSGNTYDRVVNDDIDWDSIGN
jgi:hypothetical protein